MAVAGNEVTVWNGTPQREVLLRWALQRFADAGLPAPAPTSVMFLPPVADPWTTYGFEPGDPGPGPAQHRGGLRRRGLPGVAGPGTGLHPHRAGPPLGGHRRPLDRLAGFAEARRLEWAGRGAPQSRRPWT